MNVGGSLRSPLPPLIEPLLLGSYTTASLQFSTACCTIKITNSSATFSLDRQYNKEWTWCIATRAVLHRSRGHPPWSNPTLWIFRERRTNSMQLEMERQM